MMASPPKKSVVLVGVALAAIAVALALEPKPAIPAPAVEASPDAGSQTSLGRFVVTARWGRTAGPMRKLAAHERSATVWDGTLAIDCGQIVSVTPLGMELGGDGGVSGGDGHEGVGAVTAAGHGAKVAFTSSTDGDWDGLRAVVVACPDRGEGGSTLTVQTRQRRFAARLAWSADDFVALPVGGRGEALEIHTSPELDPRGRNGSRITGAAADQIAMR